MSALHRCPTVLLVLVGCCVMPEPSARTSQDPPPATRVSAPAPPLTSQAETNAWLAAQAGRPTPLDALPPLARRRFIDSLVFGSGGLGGFAYGDLEAELTPSQARAVLRLFGMEEYADDIETRLAEGEAWPGSAEPSRIEREFDMLYRKRGGGRSVPADAAALYAKDFAPLFKGDALSDLSLRDLVHAMRAAQLIAQTSLEPQYSSDVSAAVQELERRGKATASDLRAAYDGLLMARRFDDARRFADRHPDAKLPALPVMRDPLPAGTKAATLWRFDRSGQSLVRTPLDLAPAQILVMAGCHFSQDAAEDIGKDPVLGPLFARHAHWLFLPLGREDLDAARQWNRRFPDAQVGMLHVREEWPLLPEPWAMPTFLFVRNGRVVEHLEGWPRNPERQRQPLIDAARRLGLLAE